MSAVKISQLPEWSGTPSDTRWFVMNNSGETETFKFSGYTSLIGPGTGTQSIRSIYYGAGASTGDYNVVLGGINNQINSGVEQTLLGGHANYIQSTGTGNSGHTIVGSYSSYIDHTGQWPGLAGIYNSYDSYIYGESWSNVLIGGTNNYTSHAPMAVVIGGQDNSVRGQPGGFAGGRGVVIGGFGNYINEWSAQENSGIFVGYNSYIDTAAKSVLVGGASSNIQSGGPAGIFMSDNTSIVGANYNTSAVGTTAGSLSSCSHGHMAGGYGNTLTQGNCLFVSGRGNQLTGNYNDCDSGIYQSWNSISYQAGKASVILGGYYNRLYDSSHYALIAGGEGNYIYNTSESSAIISSKYSTIRDVDDTCVILGASGGTINGISSGARNIVNIGSYNTDFTAYGTIPTNTIMLGLFNRTVDSTSQVPVSATTFTENLHIYRTESKETLTGQTATGDVTVDLSAQSVFEFEITGDITSITFTNWREGGIYEFVVHNTGSYTITAAGVTLGGTANTVYAKGGAINPTNNGYTFYHMMIINGKGWLNEHLNFQAL